mmetsp:Transcript_48346/g.121782  ORF Transcript_48346/g.121782 Transcript_48346/m.121782 type:complete len:321 (-) Transcript_48346:216-1178(-)
MAMPRQASPLSTTGLMRHSLLPAILAALLDVRNGGLHASVEPPLGVVEQVGDLVTHRVWQHDAILSAGSSSGQRSLQAEDRLLGAAGARGHTQHRATPAVVGLAERGVQLDGPGRVHVGLHGIASGLLADGLLLAMDLSAECDVNLCAVREQHSNVLRILSLRRLRFPLLQQVQASRIARYGLLVLLALEGLIASLLQLSHSEAVGHLRLRRRCHVVLLQPLDTQTISHIDLPSVGVRVELAQPAELSVELLRRSALKPAKLHELPGSEGPMLVKQRALRLLRRLRAGLRRRCGSIPCTVSPSVRSKFQVFVSHRDRLGP